MHQTDRIQNHVKIFVQVLTFMKYRGDNRKSTSLARNSRPEVVTWMGTRCCKRQSYESRKFIFVFVKGRLINSDYWSSTQQCSVRYHRELSMFILFTFELHVIWFTQLVVQSLLFLHYSFANSQLVDEIVDQIRSISHLCTFVAHVVLLQKDSNTIGSGWPLFKWRARHKIATGANQFGSEVL